MKYFLLTLFPVLRYYLYINMFKRFIPFAHANSIYEIPVDFYQQNGVTLLLIDLDNTLDSYRLYTPTERAVKLIDNLRIHHSFHSVDVTAEIRQKFFSESSNIQADTFKFSF